MIMQLPSTQLSSQKLRAPCHAAATYVRLASQTVRSAPSTSYRLQEARSPAILQFRSRSWLTCASSSDGVEPSSSSYTYQRIATTLDRMDANQLQTALATAIAAEDYSLAAKVRDQMLRQAEDGGAGSSSGGSSGSSTSLDWQELGIPGWLADRAERLGYRFPTDIQRRSAPVLLSGRDAVVQSVTGSGKTLAFLVPALARLNYPPELLPEDLEGPQLLLVVPTFELGVQVAMLVYKLLGGNISSGRPGDPANMFTYTGPRGIKVKGILTEEEVAMARESDSYTVGTHVIVGTPAALLAVQSGPNGRPVLDSCKVVVVDEVDACLQEDAEATGQLLSSTCSLVGTVEKPQVILVGATVSEPDIQSIEAAGWITNPARLAAGRPASVPHGIQHRYAVATGAAKLKLLARMLRQDVALAAPDAAPARVMVFANSEEEARAAADPLRTVLWDDHKLSVLLPSGAEPIKALHAFRDNQATLLLCTPTASRGLDLPAVSHVYNLSLPLDATQYLHRAGRAGRIGSTTGGVVTTLVTPEELPKLQAMAAELSIELLPGIEEVDVGDSSSSSSSSPTDQPAQDLTVLKRDLEDLYNLM